MNSKAIHNENSTSFRLQAIKEIWKGKACFKNALIAIRNNIYKTAPTNKIRNIFMEKQDKEWKG